MFITFACFSRSVATALSLFFATAVFASEANSDWYERAWESADGLPDNSVCGVAQTPDGFLWIATSGGLMRFDGVQFEQFPLANLDGVPNRVVRNMLLDQRGWLWLDMDRGPVVCIGPNALRVFTNGLPDRRATYMADDAEGAIWITYDNGSLVRIQDGRVSSLDSAGWRDGEMSSLTSDSKGRLWFGNGKRVGIFKNGTFRTLLTLQQTVWCIGKKQGGGIWICAGHSLMSFNEGQKPQQFGDLPANQIGNEATAILEDRTGSLWVGTAGDGLFRFDGTNIEHVPTSYRSITCLTEDDENNIWAGTEGGGLDRLRPRIIDLLGTASGLPYESVRSICEDTSGKIWVVAQSGPLGRLECWQNGSWSEPLFHTNEPTGKYSGVAANPQGGVWISTRDNGMYYFNNGISRNWRRGNGLASDNVRSILETSTGDLFVATDGPIALQRFRDGRWQRLTLPIETHTLRCLVEDVAGRLWVGSADGYLFRVEGDKVVNETPGDLNHLLSIRSLAATSDGSLWIGYAGWGIGWFKDGHFGRVTSEQGLHDDYVSQMMPDDRGWLWCAGNRGIFQVPWQQLRSVAEGRRNQVRCIGYSHGEGFPNLQPNYENIPGALRSRDGRIWFPMHTGVAVIFPDRVSTNTMPPPALLEQVTLDGEPIAKYNRYIPLNLGGAPAAQGMDSSNLVLQLPPALRKLNFDFTAPSFTVPENVQFQYRLKGLDTNWVESGTTRSVSYSRLPPGNYRFEVRATDFAGVSSENVAALRFVVLPFYWETWWFRLAVLAAFTLVVTAIVRYVSFRRLHRQLRAMEQQAALQRERTRIAKDIHDDLGANLTQIAYLGELAQQDQAEPVKAAARIEKISATARRAVKSLDEIVWAVNPRNDTLAHLIEYAGQFALDYMRTAGIRCRLDFPEQSPSRELSTDLRHNLFLVIKEALHNIVKHAHATEVWLHVSFNDHALDVTIEDDGRGFEHAPNNSFADGLRNMRQRMSDIGGDCQFESQPNRGTRVVLHLPWPIEREE